ncbi:DUF4123 domain-containing protein [Xanthomonas translucens]|uniref:DUF4123 domain-containing protein n=1 Tax=Xanthomonas campestris pv. translucens TaxID=343 RepID=UPI00071E98B7|nr:DUF4123 domain-containing protein [Xanthomonas translucens]QEO25551.1 DUF4123 domain-containing protein [Xanthomonas translucens pv. undulosa]WLA01566.1 DUF4123 domain-containing protein [Xanthomonas translucens]WLA08430.1 DUF4123 domain-containing protein [Xanthomonas translucens]
MDYALIDAAASLDTASALHAYTETGLARSLFERQPESSLADAGPWLVLLDGHVGLRHLLHVMDRHPGAVARVGADVAFEALFDHMERCLDLRLADGSLAMFRFWDGRALYRVWRVLTPAQRKAFFGPVARWSVRLQGRLWELDRSQLETLDA